jgi:hypothetical protein
LRARHTDRQAGTPTTASLATALRESEKGLF